MARLSNLAIFIRAFLVVLIAGTPGRWNSAQASDSADWAAAVQVNTAEAYLRYLSRYPAGQHIDQAIAALSRLGAISTRQGPVVTAPPRVPAIAAPVAPTGTGRGDGGRASESAGPSAASQSPSATSSGPY